MNGDLFSTAESFDKLPLEDADVYYVERALPPDQPSALLSHLILDTPWRSESIVVWGKRYVQPRLIAWYGDPMSSYKYSGISLEPMPWTDELKAVKVTIESFSGAQFNSVLLNYYRDNKDSMGFHSDDEPELGIEPTIASLSLGEERVLILRHKFNRQRPVVKLPLKSGSVLLMKGQTQRYWQHGIVKERRPCGPRVNLTFRQIRSS